MTARIKLSLALYSNDIDLACSKVCESSKLVLPELLRRWLVIGFQLWDRANIRNSNADELTKYTITYSHHNRAGEDQKFSDVLSFIYDEPKSKRGMLIRHLALLGFEFESGVIYAPELVSNSIVKKAEKLPVSITKLESTVDPIKVSDNVQSEKAALLALAKNNMKDLM